MNTLLVLQLGILKVILDAVLEGRTSDVIVVPISIQYERVLEGRTYVVSLRAFTLPRTDYR